MILTLSDMKTIQQISETDQIMDNKQRSKCKKEKTQKSAADYHNYNNFNFEMAPIDD